MTNTHIFLVGIGGFLGAIARYAISTYLNGKSIGSLPWGTLTVNVVGSFLLGIMTGAKADIMVLLLFGTGFMGAFTTFSTLKLEMTQMYVKKNKRNLLLYTIATYGLGILFAYIGYVMGRNV